MKDINDIGKITVNSIPIDTAFQTTVKIDFSEEYLKEIKRRWSMSPQQRIQEDRDKKLEQILTKQNNLDQ